MAISTLPLTVEAFQAFVKQSENDDKMFELIRWMIFSQHKKHLQPNNVHIPRSL